MTALAIDVMPVAEGPISSFVTKQFHNIYKYEAERLRTFNSWPESAPISPERLARAGFYYSGSDESVICFECGGRINQWSPEDTAITKHRHYFPNCKFVIGVSDDIPLVSNSFKPNNLSINGNNSINRQLLLSSSDPSPSSSPINGNSSESSLSTSPSMITSLSNEPIIQNGSQFETLFRDRNLNQSRNDFTMSSFLQLMKDERNRLRSYYIRDNSRWNLPFIRPEDLAKAGLYFLNEDRVQCAFCTGVIHNWTPGDRPLEEHARHYPRCPFIMEEDVGNIPIGNDPLRSPLPVLGHDVCGNRDPFEESANSFITTNPALNSQPIDIQQMGIQPYSGPINPDMGPIEARKKTFEIKGWDNNVPVSVDKLIEAGFYYIGYSDAVKCFHCNGGLTDWEVGDDPWIEHAKKFPKCHFLRLNKSESFIAECLAANGTQTPNNDDNNSDNELIVCQIVDQWMNSEIVQQLIRINEFSIDLIKATLNQRYYRCKKPFESFAHIYDAVSEANLRRNNPLVVNQMPSTEPLSEVITTTAMSSSTANTLPKIEANSEPIVRSMPESESRLLCKICYLKEIGVVFLPCGHQLACGECAQRLTDCPICRQPIRGYVRTFFS